MYTLEGPISLQALQTLSGARQGLRKQAAKEREQPMSTRGQQRSSRKATGLLTDGMVQTRKQKLGQGHIELV